MTLVHTPSPDEYNFQFDHNEAKNTITSINIIREETKSGSAVNAQGKITKGNLEEFVGKNNSRMLKCALTDETGTIPIVIWEDEINDIKSNYLLLGLGVRYREQTTYLTTTRTSRISIIQNEELKNLDDSNAQAILQPKSDQVVRVASIRSVVTEMFRCCIECSAKIPPSVETNLVRCLRCDERMRLQDCKVNVIAKVTILVKDSAQTLTIFSEVIEKFFGEGTNALTSDEIEEKLLLAENIEISFNNENVVTLIEYQG